MVMNKNTQMELTAYTDKHKLPYYDKIEFDEHGWLVTPPGEHRLSDDGRWSLLLTRKRYETIVSFPEMLATINSERR